MAALNLETLRTASPASPAIVALSSVIVGAQLGTLAGAVLTAPVLWALAAAVSILADIIGNEIPRVRGMFANAAIGLTARALVRELALVVLLVQEVPGNRAVVLVACAVPLSRGMLRFLTTPERVLLLPRISTLNLEFPALARRWVPLPGVRDLVLATLVVVPGALVGLLGGPWWPFLVLTGALEVGCVAWAAVVAAAALRRRHRPVPEEFAEQARTALNRERPELLLYYAGNRDSVYQVNMWLPVVEALGRRAVVVLRSRAAIEDLAPTSLPVVAIPSAVDLMNFRMPTVRVSFVVAHLGNNIHILREPRMKHVFIGHGESDKVASVNPMTKAFDEVWVAGPASRRRWHQARVGIDDESIIEVGRPQLGGILPAVGDRGNRPLSVLYAPTWEGWIKGAANASSVADLGVDIVRWLLARPDTRIIYKPHPLTGIVSGRARAANEEMIRLVRSSPTAGEVRLGASEEEWRAVADRDLVAGPGGPPLYECFNRSDVLLGDISSVVPDYLASGKPYLIPNPHELDHHELRADMASMRAAYIMDPDPDRWEPLLAEAVGQDPMATARRELRLDVLGPRHEDPVDPWREALTRLLDRANAQWPDAVREAEILPE